MVGMLVPRRQLGATPRYAGVGKSQTRVASGLGAFTGTEAFAVPGFARDLHTGVRMAHYHP